MAIFPTRLRTAADRWALNLRCAKCKSLFTVRGVSAADIAQVPHAAACPDCGNEPGVNSTFFLSARQHLIVALEKERTQS